MIREIWNDFVTPVQAVAGAGTGVLATDTGLEGPQPFHQVDVQVNATVQWDYDGTLTWEKFGDSTKTERRHIVCSGDRFPMRIRFSFPEAAQNIAVTGTLTNRNAGTACYCTIHLNTMTLRRDRI